MQRVGGDWHIVGLADFNGDGKSDILWRNADGRDSIWEMNGDHTRSVVDLSNVGGGWHTVVVILII
jgi:hypothetical protein